MNSSKQTLPNETEPERNNGILPAQSLRTLIQNGVIAATDALPIKEEQIQPASLDLRLGDVAYRVQASFVPQNSTVEHGIRELGLKITNVDLTRATVFEKGCVYIVPLLEELNLPDDISAWANPKSSTGITSIITARAATLPPMRDKPSLP